MGRAFRAAGRACGHAIQASEGGGFRLEQLRCDRCGQHRTVDHQDIWDDCSAMLKGLETLTPDPDSADWRTYLGEPITRDEDFRRALAEVEVCQCGGRFEFDAPVRRPTCRSKDVVDDGTSTLMYD